MDKKYLSYTEFAAELGVCNKTVQKWVKTGRIKMVQFGKRTFRIPIAELNREATPPPPRMERHEN